MIVLLGAASALAMSPIGVQNRLGVGAYYDGSAGIGVRWALSDRMSLGAQVDYGPGDAGPITEVIAGSNTGFGRLRLGTPGDLVPFGGVGVIVAWLGQGDGDPITLYGLSIPIGLAFETTDWPLQVYGGLEINQYLVMGALRDFDPVVGARWYF